MTQAEILEMKENFQNRNIEFEFFKNRNDLLEDVKDIVDQYNSIGVGNSQTLKTLGVTELLSALGKTVYDKTLVKSKDEINKIKKLALVSDCYISSSNALSFDGKIVNVDHSGNTLKCKKSYEKPTLYNWKFVYRLHSKQTGLQLYFNN